MTDTITDPHSLPYVPGSETSKAAAQGARSKAPADRVRVYNYIHERGEYGATSDEVQVALGLTHQSGSARVSELASKHHVIRRTDRTRPTRTGHKAFVYVAAEDLLTAEHQTQLPLGIDSGWESPAVEE